MSLLRIAMVAALAAAPACGGGDKKAAVEPAAEADTAGEEEGSGGDGEALLPPEKLDEIQSFFDRKRNTVSRCYTQALDAREVKVGTKGYVTVSMTILPDGRLDNVQVAEAKPDSPVLKSCVLSHVSRWTVTTLPKPLDYSYSFGFDAL